MTGIVARGIVVLAIVVAGLGSPAHAGSSTENRGKAIFEELDRRNSGYQDLQVDLKMILRNSLGAESERLLSISMLEVPAGGDKLLIVFDTPKAIKGTALLSVGHPVEPDDQWLYLPALKRVKRISSRNKSGSFMGSEFAYEDIASQEIEKYTYRWLRDETYDNMECFVIERYPVDRENSGYTRQVVWIDKAEYNTRKVEYYDRKNALLKTLTMTGYEKYDDRFWRASDYNIVNHQTGKSTELQFANYQFHVGLTDDDFNKNSLKRAR